MLIVQTFKHIAVKIDSGDHLIIFLTNKFINTSKRTDIYNMNKILLNFYILHIPCAPGRPKV